MFVSLAIIYIWLLVIMTSDLTLLIVDLHNLLVGLNSLMLCICRPAFRNITCLVYPKMSIYLYRSLDVNKDRITLASSGDVFERSPAMSSWLRSGNALLALLSLLLIYMARVPQCTGIKLVRESIVFRWYPENLSKNKVNYVCNAQG